MSFAKLPLFSLWIRSAAYTGLMAFNIIYILSKGMQAIATSGNASGVLIGILQCILACALFCAFTLIFMHRTPAAFFPQKLTESDKTEIQADMRSVLKLLAALTIFVLSFAVIAGLLALLIYYIGIGIDGDARKLPVTIAVYLFTILSLPCFINIFANYASGERVFSQLLRSGVRIGAMLYGKYLLLAAVTFGLATGIRFLCAKFAAPADMIVTIILSAAILGVSIPLSLSLLARQNFADANSGAVTTENTEHNDNEVQFGA